MKTSLVVLGAAGAAVLIVCGVLLAPGQLRAPAQPGAGTPPTPTGAATTNPIGKPLAALQPSLAATIDPLNIGYTAEKRVPFVRGEANGVTTTVYGPLERVQGLTMAAVPKNDQEFASAANAMGACIAGVAGGIDQTAAAAWITSTAAVATPGEAPAPPSRQGEVGWSATEGVRFKQEERTLGTLRVRLRYAHESSGAKRRMLQLSIGREVAELQ